MSHMMISAALSQGTAASDQRLVPLRLALGSDPEDAKQKRRVFPAAEVPFIVLVVADFLGRPDPQPIEDRRPFATDRARLDAALAASKLRFRVPHPAADAAQLAVRRLSDFDAAAIEEQIRAVAGLTGPALAEAVGAALRSPGFLAAERAWRALARLVERAGPEVQVEIMNATKEDLVADFEDAPELAKSGLHKIANQYNHHGMRPYAAVFFDFAVGFGAHDRLLLRQLGELGRTAALPMIACAPSPLEPILQGPAETAELATWRATPDARYVALASPSFVLRPAHTPGDSALLGPASALLAERLIDSFQSVLAGTDLGKAGSDAELIGEIPESLCDLAAQRGVALFVLRNDRPMLLHDVHLGASDAPLGRSLAARFLVTRLVHQALKIEYLQGLSAADPDPARLAERLNRALAVRLAPIPAVRAEVSNLRWDDTRRDWLHATMSVTAPVANIASPSDTAPQPTTWREPVVLRLDR